MKRLVSAILLGTLLCLALPGHTQATAPEHGLLITPLRQYLSANAGSSTGSTFSVANLTAKPLDVTFSVQQFSVADYTYDYTFSKPGNDWLHLGQTTITLQPNQTRGIAYSLNIPAHTAPGGYYYTLFASANLASQGINSTIQAADLLYLTVNGRLSTVSHLAGSSIQFVSFGRSIPYTLQPVNTGNVYGFVYLSSRLHGLFVRPAQTSSAHVLIPGKVRNLSGSIPSPVLPGIYRAVYGYKTGTGWVIQQSRWIIYLPPWSIAFALAIALFAGKIVTRRRSRKTPGQAPPTDTNQPSDTSAAR